MLRKHLWLYTLLFGLFWTALTLLSGVWVSLEEKNRGTERAKIEARSVLDRDMLYRRWAAMHGGLYAPVTGKTQPNPYLAGIPERDITTPSGRALTLINPASMTRQVHELGKKYGLNGHITSLNPINPGNAPDPWERQALTRIAAGETEVSSVETLHGEPQLRLMRPLATEKGCLKCHAAQGYKEGDIRGGLSVSMPMAPYVQLMKQAQSLLLLTHFAVWLAGALLFGVGVWLLRAQILKQEQAEAELRESEERFALAASGSSNGLWDWPDLDQDARWWSAQWYHLLGYEENEIPATGENLRLLLHPDDLPRIEEAWQLHFEKRIPFDLEYRMRCKDGTYRWFRGRGQALWGADGRPRRMSGSIEDIHARRIAEQALKQAALEWSAAMDASDDVIYLLDCQRRIVWANRTFCQLTGSSPQEVTGRHIAEVLHPQGEETPCPVCRAQNELRDFRTIMEADHPDNPAGRPIEVTVKIVRDSGGEPLSILMTLHDLTGARQDVEERTRLEMQLRQSQKMEAIGTLAGGIAHDFNNILSVIFGYTELAKIEDGDPEKRQQHLGQVLTGARRAKELVQQILAFSRKAEQQKQLLHVSSIVKEALKMLRASIPATIEIRQRIASDGMVLADPTQIHQVIVNLCTNAYQAMRETGGILTVSLEEIDILGEDEGDATLFPGRYLKLGVSNTGDGISPEILDKIFEPYFTTKKTGEGTGLGLAVVHGIVKSHNGHITVRSEPGAETTFQVYLPLVEDERKAAGLPTEENIVNLSGKGERILFVDDEEQIRTFAEMLFSKHGYQVSTFSNGVQALEEFRNHPDQFDLVITDMTMPHMTGAELAQKILGIRPDVPIILCTGQSELIDREKAFAMGVRAYLNKPVLQHDFLSAIRKALEKNKLEPLPG
ncbi:MAG: PAS domain-containing protein [Desulfurivibrionaceae bacterium]